MKILLKSSYDFRKNKIGNIVTFLNTKNIRLVYSMCTSLFWNLNIPSSRAKKKDCYQNLYILVLQLNFLQMESFNINITNMWKYKLVNYRVPKNLKFNKY